MNASGTLRLKQSVAWLGDVALVFSWRVRLRQRSSCRHAGGGRQGAAPQVIAMFFNFAAPTKSPRLEPAAAESHLSHPLRPCPAPEFDTTRRPPWSRRPPEPVHCHQSTRRAALLTPAVLSPLPATPPPPLHRQQTFHPSVSIAPTRPHPPVSPHNRAGPPPDPSGPR
ncbi:hypothetical protein B0J12DRAFT_335784 [Macrophomina phaseolina]|uniref:Uncharacterized protein n=1 Tax=Macrophomina phaseolina TaxID=35725 RepID=A0ABQ8GLG7_9PEZI|nr:hypothetical protein B0J12DRAFT_335784 [Macrophomina phaseolina]